MPAVARRAHKKSRFGKWHRAGTRPRHPLNSPSSPSCSSVGCSQCKLRKIKCNEQQPCSYCVKKRYRCSLTDDPDTREPSEFKHQVDQEFSVTDFALFRHFIKEVAVDHADDIPSEIAWAEHVSSLATQHDYLLHQILALSALHMRILFPRQSEELEQIACTHQARSLPLFRDALSTDLETDSLALFVCSVLIIPHHFALTNDPMLMILNEKTQSPPEWLLMLDGATRIVTDFTPKILSSPLRPLLGQMARTDVDNPLDSPDDRELVRLKDTMPFPEGKKDGYTRLLDVLRACFTLSNTTSSALEQKSAALRFPPYFSVIAKNDLANKHPAALVVLMSWLVLLLRVENRWWLKGRVKPIGAAIQQLLPREHRRLIAWPSQQLGLSLGGDGQISIPI
ncbi:hypothetical protein F5Y18DRAFT_420755 [Xylariaceae sp. FL1019]|nr:hypothetical protein F5Y18DRAFT_420755 [Xylariaceae sp. FL1019]